MADVLDRVSRLWVRRENEQVERYRETPDESSDEIGARPAERHGRRESETLQDVEVERRSSAK